MMQKRVRNPLVLLAMLTFVFFASSSGNGFAASKQTKRTKPQATKKAARIIELHSIDQLKVAFQQDHGKVRLVTILSPT